MSSHGFGVGAARGGVVGVRARPGARHARRRAVGDPCRAPHDPHLDARTAPGERLRRPEAGCRAIRAGQPEAILADATAIARHLVSATGIPPTKAILLHPAETGVEVSRILMGGLHGCVDSAMDEERIVRAVTTVAPGGAVVLPAPGRDGRSGCW